MSLRAICFLGLLAVVLSLRAHRFSHGRCGKNCVLESKPSHPGFLNTTVRYFEQDVDHFSFAQPSGLSYTFKQRYLVYDGFVNRENPVIFVYTGNEGNVELYANATGLMWENAEHYGALLLWVEHRYYGESLPFSQTNATWQHMEYLTSEQALADYAKIILELKREWKMFDAPVIAFGGSYGGMLSSWLRMKYPAAVDGAIAASAPILAFAGEDPHSLTPYWDSESYWTVVTRDASAAGGSSAQCSAIIHSIWPTMLAAGESEEGRAKLSKVFGLCQPLENAQKARELAELVKYAFDTMAMGNFPFASSYLTGSSAELPPFPVRAACDVIVKHYNSNINGDKSESNEWVAIQAVQKGAAIYTNVTGDACLTLPADVEEDGIWDYQWCTELQPQETYFTCNGKDDMFWSEPFNFTNVQSHCLLKYGVAPRLDWVRVQYGGMKAVEQASNIVFSNGNLDPWSSGGVKKNVSESVVAIEIPLGAHHLDLMFSTPDDPPCVTFAREFHLTHITKWIEQARGRKKNM